MITLNIEQTEIKIMQVTGKRIDLAVRHTLEPGMVEDGVIMDKTGMGQLIKQLMSENGIKEKRVVAGISGIHSIYRVVKLPKLPSRLQAEAANREMGRVMPVPLNEVYTSWQAVETTGGETVFCLVGLPRNSVDAMLDTLREAGLESRLMDVKPLAVARVSDEKDALVINIQPASFDIILMLDGVPELLRSITFSGSGSSPEEKIALIKEELDRTVSFHNTGHKTTPVTEDTVVFISGEHAQLLAEQLNYRVKPIPQFLQYPDGFDPDSFAVNIGLALKQIKTGNSRLAVDINTIPDFYLPKARPVFGYISVALFIIVLIIIVFTVMQTKRELDTTAQLQERVTALQSQIQARQGTTTEVDELKINLADAEAARDEYLDLLTNYEAKQEKVNVDLSKVTSLLPGSVDLTSIDYEEKKNEKEGTIQREWRVNGIAPDESVVINYSNDLKNTIRFDTVIVSTQILSYNNVSFTIIMTTTD
jgi:type IV pilus assembly protein PilM